uniref:Uncharacterized protein n=1 Tax=Quercus lobata TaxID=97700 RepID=A0A7N2L0B4_QUELO
MIDGKQNTKIQSILMIAPIRKASFLPDGSQVIILGRREEKSLEDFEVSPDSSTIAFVGYEGYILLVSNKT